MTIAPDWIAVALVALGTFALRALGVLAAGRLRDDDALFRWITCVAFAIAAGVMVKVLLVPEGVLAGAPLAARAAGLAAAVGAFALSGRRLFVGLGAGVATFLVVSALVPLA